MFSKRKVRFFGFFQKSAIWRLFSLTKNSYFLNFCKLYKIGTMCTSLEHEEFVKATCNESLVNISRLGKLRSTRYSAYSSDMGIFDLKSAKLNDFCHFPRKKLDFEVFSQISWFMLWKLKNCSKGFERVAFTCCIIAISPCKVALMKNGFFGFFQKSTIWRLISLLK